MAPRGLSKIEARLAKIVVGRGTSNTWEYAAFLASPTGPLLELRTDREVDRAEPSPAVVASGLPVVLHHNHLSQESLSFADWFGLSTLFDEAFAHCADGTVYWGRVLGSDEIHGVLKLAQSHEMNVQSEITRRLLDRQLPSTLIPGLAQMFRKDVLNRAMRLRAFVEYEVAWGTCAGPLPYVPAGNPPAPGTAGQWGAVIQPDLDLAAAQIAPSL